MKKYIVSTIIPIVALFLVSFSSLADPTSLGFGANISDSPYKGYGASYDPLPHIDYDNGDFFIDDTSFGSYLYNNNDQELSMGLAYLANEFNPKASSNKQLKQLNKRHATLVAQLLYSATTPIGLFSASLSGDVLNESNSMLIDVNYSVPIFANLWTFVETFGMNWANSQHNDYYYGISHSESMHSNLAPYHAKSSITPYMAITANYALTNKINTYIGVRVDKLMDDVKHSPMIANSTVPNFYGGIYYQF